jgi:hypothetical protein
MFTSFLDRNSSHSIASTAVCVCLLCLGAVCIVARRPFVLDSCAGAEGWDDDTALEPLVLVHTGAFDRGGNHHMDDRNSSVDISYSLSSFAFRHL